ncbi:HAD subfamily IIID h [Lentinula raphanica]|nr:HAD subfamily IIID h [Lentinula raphanica]
MEVTLHPSTAMRDDDPLHEAKDESASIATEAQVTKSTTEFDQLTQSPERWVTLQFTWAGKSFSLDIADSDRVFDLKTSLHELTRVPPERQKILGLVKGKLPPDQGRISDLHLTTGKKFTLLGTPEGDEIKDPSQLENLPDVVNDLDVDFSKDPNAFKKYNNDQRNIRKVKEMTDKLNVNVIHPLREGKKLLVLDIDYTILDTKPLTSGSLPPAECARPGLHEFLEGIYPYYDICIWSQTSWIWLETKLVELGMIGANRNYQISFVLDKTSMFTVFTDRNGKSWQHYVKALQIIWNHFPQFNASNTIHVDDLGRNFALNPQCGLKIHAFKNAHTEEARADRELDKLARYMVHIAPLNDLRVLSHANWKTVVKSLPRT